MIIEVCGKINKTRIILDILSNIERKKDLFVYDTDEHVCLKRDIENYNIYHPYKKNDIEPIYFNFNDSEWIKYLGEGDIIVFHYLDIIFRNSERQSKIHFKEMRDFINITETSRDIILIYSCGKKTYLPKAVDSVLYDDILINTDTNLITANINYNNNKKSLYDVISMLYDLKCRS